VYRGERDGLGKYQQTVAHQGAAPAVLHPRLPQPLHSERHILATAGFTRRSRCSSTAETLEDGTPYLVMEHVDGDPSTFIATAAHLFVRNASKCSWQVCTAVQYAHRQPHRYIAISRPRNIFITGDGTAKLLDFGIAKLLAPESLSHTLPVTRLQERILNSGKTPRRNKCSDGRSPPRPTSIPWASFFIRLLTGRSPYRLLSFSQLQLDAPSAWTIPYGRARWWCPS